MSFTGATVRVWAGLQETGRCKYCRRGIVWLTTSEGKALPFNVGFTVRERQTHPDKRVHVDVVAREDIHDCPERRQAQRDEGKGAARRLF